MNPTYCPLSPNATGCNLARNGNRPLRPAKRCRSSILRKLRATRNGCGDAGRKASVERKTAVKGGGEFSGHRNFGGRGSAARREKGRSKSRRSLANAITLMHRENLGRICRSDASSS
ncbi:hypothetical protein Trydic_g8712 [Trypoxylus dichotomus]